MVPLVLPMVTLAPLAVDTVQGSMVANGTIGKISNCTISGTPNVAVVCRETIEAIRPAFFY